MSARSFYHMHVEPKHHSVLLLRLPGNVEREIYRAKNEILRNTGAVSTQTPPILPLAAVARNIADAAVDTLPQEEISPLQLGPMTETGGYIVVSATLGAKLVGWVDEAATGPVPNNQLFNRLPGFLIASATDVGLDACQLPDTQKFPKRATVLRVEVWSIEVRSDPWWLSYSWQVAWSRRIKLRG